MATAIVVQADDLGTRVLIEHLERIHGPDADALVVDHEAGVPTRCAGQHDAPLARILVGFTGGRRANASDHQSE